MGEGQEVLPGLGLVERGCKKLLAEIAHELLNLPYTKLVRLSWDCVL